MTKKQRLVIDLTDEQIKSIIKLGVETGDSKLYKKKSMIEYIIEKYISDHE